MAGFAHGLFAEIAAGGALDDAVRAGRRMVGIDGNSLHHIAIGVHVSTRDLAIRLPSNRFVNRRFLDLIDDRLRGARPQLPFTDLRPTSTEAPSSFDWRL